MVLKRNGEIKSCGVANGSLQRTHADKDDCTSPIPYFQSLQFVAFVAAKEERCVATVDLSGHFLQTEDDSSEEMTIVKVTGAVALLVVEIYEDR